MRKLFIRCVVLATLWGASVALAGSPGPGGPEAASAAPLTGTSWSLVSLGGLERWSGPAATLRFDAEGTLGGFDGCNSYQGTFRVDGSAIRMPGKMAATLMACAEPLASQASAFTQTLGRAASFAIDGDRLRLLDGAGQELAAFEAASLALAGTSWEVLGYNNGRQAVVSVLLGTRITARFGEDGRVTGSAGCNQYFASWETAAGTISIGMPASTRMSCPEPDGIMEQEVRYLEALHMAATFRREGEKLELRTVEGALAVTLGRDPATPPAPDASPGARLRFDLDRLGADGLQGPPDGRRALHYEYCIPDRPEAIGAVSGIDPTLQIQGHSPGRAGCGADELLCLGHTHQPDHVAVLERLARLPFIAEIREAHFE